MKWSKIMRFDGKIVSFGDDFTLILALYSLRLKSLVNSQICISLTIRELQKHVSLISVVSVIFCAPLFRRNIIYI